MSAWVKAAEVAEVFSSGRKCVDLGGSHQVCLFKLDNDIVATGAWCSHEKASLALGDVEEGRITCPLHGAQFDLRTGQNLTLPAVRPIPAYEVKIEEGIIYVKVD